MHEVEWQEISFACQLNMRKIFSGEKKCFFFFKHIIKKTNVRLQLGVKWETYKKDLEKSSPDAYVKENLQSPRSLLP